jgi:hypothetical protein
MSDEMFMISQVDDKRVAESSVRIYRSDGS